MSVEIDEACASAMLLLRMDPKSANDQTNVHTIQLAVRRLLTVTAHNIDKSSLESIQRRQLEVLSKMLRHFGPSPIRPLRLLIAEAIFKCIGANSPQTRKMAALLHKWILVIFGADVAQQRCEFLAVALTRLACQHMGVDFRGSEEGVGQQNQEANYEIFYAANKAALVDTEARLAEQLTQVSPLDLFHSYCEALVELINPVRELNGSSITADVFLPSLLTVFDVLSDVFMKIRANHCQISDIEAMRIQNISVPYFDLISSLSRSTFRHQLIPVSRRIVKPLLYAGATIAPLLEGNPNTFISWARAFRSTVETFGFRVPSAEESIAKSNLDLIIRVLRNNFASSSTSAYSCSVVSKGIHVFSAVLSRSISAQRTPAIDSTIASALQIVTAAYSSTSDRHLRVRCCKAVSSFLSVGIVSPPFTSSGTPCTHPTISNCLSVLSIHSHNADIDVAETFRAALSSCLIATARPLAPPLVSNYVSNTNVSQPIPPSSVSSTTVVEKANGELSGECHNRRRMRSDSLISDVSIPFTEKMTEVGKPPAVETKRVKVVSDEEEDDDVVILPDSEYIMVSKPTEHPKKPETTAQLSKNDSALIDGLFSSFVAAPPDGPIVL